MIPQLTNLDRPQYGGRFSTALVETKWTSGGWLERIGGALVTGHFATSRDLYNRVRLLFSTVNSIVLLSRNREKKGRKREREGESGSRIPPRVFFFSFFLLLFLSFLLSVALQRFKIRPGSRRSVTCRHRGCIIMRARAPCLVSPLARWFRASRCIRN